MLFVSIAFRAYALSLSFDPVLSLEPAASDRLENAFGAYYLVPLVLACGVLWLEGGCVSRSMRTQRWTMLIPIIATVLSIPSDNSSLPYAEFLQRFIEQLASPLWLTLLASCAFYGWAWWRGVALAEFGVLMVLVLLTVVHSETTNVRTLQAPVAWPLFVIAVIEVIIAHRTKLSVRALIGSVSLAVGVSFYLFQTEALTVRIAVLCMTSLAVLLWIGLHFQDRLAALCRRVGAILLVVTTIAGNIWSAELSQNESEFSLRALAFTVTMIGLAWWYATIVRMPHYMLAGLCNLGIGVKAAIWYLLNWLRSVAAWQGITSFLLGLLWLLVAVLISSWKAGWLRPAVQRLHRFIALDKT